MAARALELYHWEPSNSALKVLVCLHEKGLDFASRYVDLLAFEQYEPAFLGLNSNGQVPVLVHGESVLTESQFINEYLDEVFPDPPLRPTTPEGLWRMRVWGKFAGEVLAPAVSTLGCHAWLAPLLREHGITPPFEAMPLPERREGWRLAAEDAWSPVQLDDSQRKLGIALDRMEARLGGNDWLVGEDFSLADIELFAWSNALDALAHEHVNETTRPGVLAWLRAMRGRPAVREAMAHARTPEPSRAFAPGPEHSRWG